MDGALRRWYRKIEAIENQALRPRGDHALDLGRNSIRRLRGELDAGLQAVAWHDWLVAHSGPEELVTFSLISLT